MVDVRDRLFGGCTEQFIRVGAGEKAEAQNQVVRQ
jgi:hypothetical protein